jgi:O-antigen/teichoic acid export membrane protein
MMFKRILKTFSALAAGHGIQSLTQLLMPPAFIAAYGVRGYGEWLVLSAAVGYLVTLDFGLQTYVLNELTALYHRNEMEQFRRLQSVGLWLMLLFVAAGAVVACGAFVLPVNEMLRISGPPRAVSWTVFCLALQVLATIPMGQVLGVYRTFGEAHRGVMWGNLYRILLLVVSLGLAWLRAPFWVIAAGQVFSILGVLLVVILSLRRSHPEACPRLDYWNGDLARRVIKPSSFFALFPLNNFLVYQVPILMLQRLRGPEIVVIFTVARMLFSFVRQGTSLVQQSIAPEVTRLNGIGEKERLVRLYVLFEGVVLSVTLIVNTGFLFAAPVVLKLWLKRPQFFDLKLFVTVLLISVVSTVKEYKIYFQYATNHHIKTGITTFLSYLVMVLICFPAIQSWGVTGLTSVWLAVELLQLALVHSYNFQFFGCRPEISLRPALRLGFLLAALLLVTFSARSILRSQDYVLQVIAAISITLAFGGFSYFLFNLREVIREGQGQFMRLRLV